MCRHIRGHSAFTVTWFIYFLCPNSWHKGKHTHTHTHLQTHTHTHIHTFIWYSMWLKFWKAETKGFPTIHQILCTLRQSKQVVRISNSFNAMYVKAVKSGTLQDLLMLSFSVCGWYYQIINIIVKIIVHCLFLFYAVS